MPRRKQQVTQERSKVLRETERDPFEDAADDEEEASQPSSINTKAKLQPEAASPTSPATVKVGSFASFSSNSPKPTESKKSKKDKKSGKKKPRAFDLELEKPKMTMTIAESSVASTNLLNSLRLINREHEQVSENANAVKHFETCKMLRRHVLRYVSR